MSKKKKETKELLKMISVYIEKSGCAWHGVQLNPKTTHDIETPGGALPPLWKNKAVIVTDAEKGQGGA